MGKEYYDDHEVIVHLLYSKQTVSNVALGSQTTRNTGQIATDITKNRTSSVQNITDSMQNKQRRYK